MPIFSFSGATNLEPLRPARKSYVVLQTGDIVFAGKGAIDQRRQSGLQRRDERERSNARRLPDSARHGMSLYDRILTAPRTSRSAVMRNSLSPIPLPDSPIAGSGARTRSPG